MDSTGGRHRRIEDLIGIMVRLRDPERGCPWDRVQTFDTIAPYTIEEAYEVADAIERRALSDLVDELGDLLFQVVFHAQIARESGAFGFDEVVDAITRKMIRRHPHVFGDADGSISEDEQSKAWEEMKAAERSAGGGEGSLLDSVPVALPALTRAVRLQRRAARCGFDCRARMRCSTRSRKRSTSSERRCAPGSSRRSATSSGIFCSPLPISRAIWVSTPESSVRAANRKFERRFRELERRAGVDGTSAEALDPAELDGIWSEIKAQEK